MIATTFVQVNEVGSESVSLTDRLSLLYWIIKKDKNLAICLVLQEAKSIECDLDEKKSQGAL